MCLRAWGTTHYLHACIDRRQHNHAPTPTTQDKAHNRFARPYSTKEKGRNNVGLMSENAIHFWRSRTTQDDQGSSATLSLLHLRVMLREGPPRFVCHVYLVEFPARPSVYFVSSPPSRATVMRSRDTVHASKTRPPS